VLDTCNYFSAHVSEYLAKSNEIMFLGEGLGEAVANEGSLKMKELTYLHCQCFNIMNISNGFLNFVKAKKGVPCIFIVLQDNKQQTLKVMKRLLEANIKIYSVIISDCTDEDDMQFFEKFSGDTKQIFYIKRSGQALSALLCIIPLQRLAYDTTIALGYDPDRPRNLAKELTT
jgi:glucosamine--fructose-6-phosphate aminotransferase (isomerizing)